MSQSIELLPLERSDYGHAETSTDNNSFPVEYIDKEGSVRSDDPSQTQRTLTLGGLVGIILFLVSGGPYGLELAVSTGGPLLAILGFFLIPLVWSVPMALMSAELSTLLPVTGGYIVWVNAAFGTHLAFHNGYWNWVVNVIDNTLYPVLFMDYLKPILAPDTEEGEIDYGLWALSLVMVASVTAMNLRGVEIVGTMSIVFMVIVIIPFCIVIGMVLEKGLVSLDAWSYVPPYSELKLGPLMMVLLWNNCGYDNCGSCAGEVKKPGRTYPMGLGISVFIVSLVYCIPVAAALCVHHEWKDVSVP
eukprot:GFYU01027064.1.p1 GENE.GFYU01027064.1~~GFYU01027064.1.p1  ORF type:complete len:303 (+),score=69.75 GFYU01027064.1:69-977(+)